jgi:putative hydrolase of HD superfamily
MAKNRNREKNIYARIADFVYETSIHSRTPRSGLWFLGSGSQSVAEHLFHTAMIAYTLAHLEPKADKHKIVLMALFHDIGEGRTSDHNYVHQRYGRLAEIEAVRDIARSIPFGQEILGLFEEEQELKTLEARLVKDADQLEWIATLRGEEVKGNRKAREWIQIAVKRLKTDAGKKLGKALIETHPDSWWFDASDRWFVDRNEKDRGWNRKKNIKSVMGHRL